MNKTKATLTLAASIITSSLAPNIALASGAISATPATFDFSGDDISSQIQPMAAPVTPLSIALYCQSSISKLGKNLFTTCFDKGNVTNLEEQVEAALSQQNFSPASIDGQNVAVRMNYRVIIQQSATNHSVLLIPNLGSLQPKLGVNYSEPQELIAQGWFKQLKTGSPSNSSFFEHNAQITRATASITTAGKASQVSLIDTSSREKTLAITRAIEGAQFIPGQVDGKSIKMKYLAIITSS